MSQTTSKEVTICPGSVYMFRPLSYDSDADEGDFMIYWARGEFLGLGPAKLYFDLEVFENNGIPLWIHLPPVTTSQVGVYVGEQIAFMPNEGETLAAVDYRASDGTQTYISITVDESGCRKPVSMTPPGVYCESHLLPFVSDATKKKYDYAGVEYSANGIVQILDGADGKWKDIRKYTTDSNSSNGMFFLEMGTRYVCGTSSSFYLSRGVPYYLRQVYNGNIITESVGPYTFLPEPPAISGVDYTPITCIGGTTAFTVKHSIPASSPPENVFYQYSIRRVKELDDSSGCDPQNVFSYEGVDYCDQGGMNAQNTLGGFSYTIEGEEGEGDFQFSAGTYILKVETRYIQGSDTLFACAAQEYKFDVEKPADRVINITDTTPPSCAGKEDGSVEFSISRLKMTSVMLEDENISIEGVAPWKLKYGGFGVGENQVLTLHDGCSEGIDPISADPDPIIVNGINIDAGPQLSLSIQTDTEDAELITPLTCESNSDGQVQVKANIPGLESYTYYAVDSTLASLSSTSTDSINTITGLSMGTHMFHVTSPGCSTADSANWQSRGLDVLPTSITVDTLGASCYGGFGQIQLTGLEKNGATLADLNLEYFVINAENDTVARDTIQSYADIGLNFGEGLYELSFVDLCSATSITSISDFELTNIKITAPGELTINRTSTDSVFVNCADALDYSLAFTITNGTAPFDVSILDSSNSSWFSSTSTETRTFNNSNLPPLAVGSYSIQVSEVGTCNNSAVSTFVVVLNNSEEVDGPIQYTPTITDQASSESYHLQCRDDLTDVSIAISGGNPFSGDYGYEVSLFKVNDSGEDVCINASFGDYKDESKFERTNETTYVFKDLALGTYYPEITDENGCTKTLSDSTFEITAPIQNLTLSAVDLEDFEGNDVNLLDDDFYVRCHDTGFTFKPASSIVQGGVGPNYTYKMDGVEFVQSVGHSHTWDSDETEFDQTFTFSVTDQNDCVRSVDYTVYRPDTLRIDSISHVTDFNHGASVMCYDSLNTGQIFVSGSGGIADYTFRIEEDSIEVEESTQFHSLLADNTEHTVFIRDQLGCVLDTSIILTRPEHVDFKYEFDTLNGGVQIACKGYEAEVVIPVWGGDITNNYKAQWENLSDQDNPDGFGATLQDTAVFDLLAGNYKVYVNDSYNCVSDTLTFTLVEPTDYLAFIEDSIDPTSPICIVDADGDNDLGTILASASGGTGPNSTYPYTFTLTDNSNDESLTQTRYSSDGSISFLTPANGYFSRTYTLRVEDVNGCFATDDQVEMKSNSDPITVKKTDFSAPSCYNGTNGSLEFRIDNGTPFGDGGFDYILTGGRIDGQQTGRTSGSIFTIDQLNDTNIEDVARYEIYVIDTYGCDKSQDGGGKGNFISNISLAAPEEIQLNRVATVRPSFRYEDDGFFALQASGGTGKDAGGFYQFSYAEYSDFEQSAASGYPSYWINNEALAQTYIVYVRDNQYVGDQHEFCQTSDTLTVPQGRIISLADSQAKDISCFGESDGSIQAIFTVDDFDPDQLSIQWENADGSAGGTLSFDEGEGKIELLSGLPPGGYQLDATYHYNVTHSFVEGVHGFSYDHTQNVQKTTPVLRTISEPNAFSIDVLDTKSTSCGIDGDGSIVFNIDGGVLGDRKFYQLQGRDRVDVIGEGPYVINGLAVGDYSMEFGVNEDCSETYNFSISEQSLDLTLVESQQPCINENNGSFRLSGNQIDLQFSIDDGATWEENAGIFTDKAKGSYTVYARMKDRTACASEAFEVILEERTMDSDEDYEFCSSSPLTVSHSTSPATCQDASDGTAQVLAWNGVAPYLFIYDGQEVDPDTLHFSPGNYSILIEDATGAQETVAFDISALDPMSAEVIKSQVSCMGSCDARIDLLIDGGSGTYQVLWDDGQEGESRSGLCVGEYSYEIYDSRNSTSGASCMLGGSITISAYPELQLSLEEQLAPTCTDGSDGQLKVAGVGGSGFYSYKWSSGSEIATVTGSPGQYTVELRDDVLGCIATAAYSIPNREPVAPSDIIVTSPTCFGSATGSIRLVLPEELSAIVRWGHDSQAVGKSISNLQAGTYTYQITTLDGCESTGEVAVTERERLNVTSTKQDVLCAGRCTGQIDISISGGRAPYTVLWSHGSNSLQPRNLCAGSYQHTVTDAYGCQFTSIVEITEPAPLLLSAALEDVLCYGGQDGSIDLSVIGGSGGYTYLWSDGSTGATLSEIKRGQYSVTVSDGNGCSIAGSYEIEQPRALGILEAKLTNPSCVDYADGRIEISPFGGTAPYDMVWEEDGSAGAVLDMLDEGAYGVTITDANGCVLERSWRLSDPSGMQFSNLSFSNPICHDGQDGSISFEVVGGSGSYEIDWINTSGSNHVESLASGEYQVVVLDQNGCEITRDFILENPEELYVSGLEDYYVLCEGGQFYLSPSSEWKSYQWQGPEEYFSEEPEISVTEGGEYYLTVTDDQDCPGYAETYVDKSENPLDIDFIRISEAVTYEPIIFVDLSTPMPETVTWLVPDDESILVRDQNNVSMELLFTEPGSYQIGIQIGLSNCQAELFKTLSVAATSSEQQATDRVEKDPMVVQIAPNPTADEVQLILHAPDDSPVKIHLIGADQKVARENLLQGSKDYLIKWNLTDLPTGVYFLVYEQGRKVKSKRIVVLK